MKTWKGHEKPQTKKETVKIQTETDQVNAQIPLLKQKFCLITILTFLQARFPFLSHLGSDVGSDLDIYLKTPHTDRNRKWRVRDRM